MAASVTYTFTNGTTADGTQVSQNFTDLVNFLNGSTVLKDGSVAMTGILTLPAVDPSSANQATRKTYVDQRIQTFAQMSITAGAAYASGAAIGPEVTITDPGYDLEVWGSVIISCLASVAASAWGLEIKNEASGTVLSTLIVPIYNPGGAFQSIGVPLSRLVHSTGSNTRLRPYLTNYYGGGTLNVLGTAGNPANSNGDIWYRRKTP